MFRLHYCHHQAFTNYYLVSLLQSYFTFEVSRVSWSEHESDALSADCLCVFDCVRVHVCDSPAHIKWGEDTPEIYVVCVCVTNRQACKQGTCNCKSQERTDKD